MTGKVFLCKSQSELLGTFTGQSTFIPVFWVEADDIVMGFYFIEVFVLVIVAVQFLTFRCKREWITVQTVRRLDEIENIVNEMSTATPIAKVKSGAEDG